MAEIDLAADAPHNAGFRNRRLQMVMGAVLTAYSRTGRSAKRDLGDSHLHDRELRGFQRRTLAPPRDRRSWSGHASTSPRRRELRRVTARGRAGADARLRLAVQCQGGASNHPGGTRNSTAEPTERFIQKSRLFLPLITIGDVLTRMCAMR